MHAKSNLIPDKSAPSFAVLVHPSGRFTVREELPDGRTEFLIGSFPTQLSAERWIASRSAVSNPPRHAGVAGDAGSEQAIRKARET